MARGKRGRDVIDVTRALLRSWPLPQPGPGGDKESRGRALVAGGSPSMPGAVLLAAVGALRAGAGKLQAATVGSAGSLVAAQIPEAMVSSLPETKSGSIAPSAAGRLAEMANRVDCVLFGPGIEDEESTGELLAQVIPHLAKPVVILDAAALSAAKAHPDVVRSLGRAILTPHAGEMAMLMDVEKREIESDPIRWAIAAAERFGAVVALKGAETIIAGPDGVVFRDRTGNVGLATSGSGDTLAGIVAGLAARGAEPVQAAAWGVHLHGAAGDALAKRIGPLGFLARELLDEIPPLMAELSPKRPKRGKNTSRK